MRCIFCLNELPGSDEHVFPLAIGGRLTTDRVCTPCNSTLGSRVDSALSDNFLIRTRRAKLGLAGRGTVPAAHELLLGVAKLAGEDGRRVQTTFNRTTGKLDIRALYHATDIVLPDGSKGRQIIVDERDIGQIPKIIQQERKRHGVRPLTDDELAAEVKKFTANVTTVENPSILIQRSFSFAYIRHAMMKIAYELAFLWLGETYLHDPRAAELSKAVCAPDPDSTDALPGYVGENEGCTAFSFWTPHEAHHLAYATAVNRQIVIAVRVFDIYAAVIPVADDAGRYLASVDPKSKLRFLAIDSVSGKTHFTSFEDEQIRLAKLMTIHQRKPPFDDPLVTQDVG